MKKLFAIAAIGLSGCTNPAPASTSADSAAVAVDAAALSEVGGDSSSAADSGTDADSSPASDGGADTLDAAQVHQGEAVCAQFADRVCGAAFAPCCSGTAPATCVAQWGKACLKAGFDQVEASATVAEMDAVTKSLGDTKAGDLTAALKACDRQAVMRALQALWYLMVDPAELGKSCLYALPLSCAKGAGRCDPKTTEVYVCAAAVEAGSSCKLSQPCKVGLVCANTGLTRAMVCAQPNATCELSDTCWDGTVCTAGKCGPQGKATPSNCTVDADCPNTMACGGGLCAPKLCSGPK
ncbi:MAG: hypothetical protein EXR77_15085 [Myxococcales bacterium]|nr:hypothetical protein [Myxococcales bacterium]